MENRERLTLAKRQAIILFVCFSIPFSIINFNAYLKGSIPSVHQALFSVLFLLVLFLCAFYMSKKNTGIFKASSWYWGVGALLSVTGYFGGIGFIFIPVAVIFAGPLYGLRYFIDIPSDIYLILLCIVIAYVVCIFGWWIGKTNKRKTV